METVLIVMKHLTTYILMTLLLNTYNFSFFMKEW